VAEKEPTVLKEVRKEMEKVVPEEYRSVQPKKHEALDKPSVFRALGIGFLAFLGFVVLALWEEIVISIFINWIIGLGPAAYLRLLRGPFSKRKAKITTGIIGFCLFFLVSFVSFTLGIPPNMAPVAVWTFLTYAILRYDANRLWRTFGFTPLSSGD